MNRSARVPERCASLVAKQPMSEDAAFLREQARRCRRLARQISTPDVVRTLKLMADDYDARADRLEENGGSSS
jgi:hypothetical protein